jgi:membrane fusion protein (multidrug efflux system)
MRFLHHVCFRCFQLQLGVLVLATAVWCRGASPAAANDASPPALGTLRGLLMPISAPQLSARAAGVIEKFGAVEGQHVKQGTLLVQLNADVERAEVTRAEAVLETATSEQERARRDLARTKELSTASIGSRKDLEDAESAFAIASGRRKQAAADVDMAKARLSDRQIFAPIDGVVFRLSRSVGEGVQGLENVIQLIDAAKLQLVVYASADLLGRFTPGQTARITVESGPARGTVITGTVSYVDPFMDPDSATFRVKFAVEPNENIQPGISVTLQLPSEVH